MNDTSNMSEDKVTNKGDTSSVASHTSSKAAAEDETSSASKNTAPDPNASVVYKVSSNDVLMGRGAAVIGNEGNRRFRKLIQKYKAAYDATRIRQEKDRIARQIVETIVSRNGRWLKKIDTPQQMELFQVPAGKAAWAVVKESVVLQKVKQAFRDDRRTFEEDRADSKGGIPTMIKAVGGGLGKTPTVVDGLLGGDSATSFMGSSALSSLLLPPSVAPSLQLGGLMPLQQQQQQQQLLLKSQLDSHLLLLAAAREQQQQRHFLDPLSALQPPPSALDEQRALFLRRVLARESALAEQTALAQLNRQAALREQLAALRSAADPSKEPAAQLPPSAFLRYRDY